MVALHHPPGRSRANVRSTSTHRWRSGTMKSDSRMREIVIDVADPSSQATRTVVPAGCHNTAAPSGECASTSTVPPLAPPPGPATIRIVRISPSVVRSSTVAPTAPRPGPGTPECNTTAARSTRWRYAILPAIVSRGSAGHRSRSRTPPKEADRSCSSISSRFRALTVIRSASGRASVGRAIDEASSTAVLGGMAGCTHSPRR